ncbi:MAG: NAD(P)/FAD-dependent oxidoreductase [Polyangiaceae bacterium]
MRRNDAYQLANLPASSKLAASFGLLLGFALFFSGFFVIVAMLSYDWSPADFIGIGQRVGDLSALQPKVYLILAGIHALSLLLIISVARALFQRTPLPRAARSALLILIGLLALVDVAGWLAAPYLRFARAILGAEILVLTVVLVAVVGYPLGSMWLYSRWAGAGGQKKRVVIVGGGFAGLYTAAGLDKLLGYHDDLDITVIDQNNFFLFPPLLPSVAAGAIETRQVTYPFRRIFEATNIRFKKETVDRIDTANRMIHSRVDVDEDVVTKKLKVRYAETTYDYLVLATGSTTQTFGTKGVDENAFFMREISDAVGVRNHVIDCFEHAARETDRQLIDEMTRFVIVGAGPTGVELASEIRELIDEVLLKHYPEIDPGEVEVILVQSGDRILPGWGDSLAANATKQLSRIRVDVRLGARVTAVGPDWVDLNDGTRIPTRTCVWCAGVKPSPLLAATDLTLHKSGRVEIESDCRAKGKADVFVLGDAAHLVNPKTQQPFPPLGQVAFQQGAQTAENLARLLRGKPTKPFKYFDYGQLVSVGAHFAAVDLMGIRLNGFLAWMIWRSLYLMKLVGFGNKVRVLLDWSLDLLIERSISQLYAHREALTSRLESGTDEAASPPDRARRTTAEKTVA